MGTQHGSGFPCLCHGVVCFCMHTPDASRTCCKALPLMLQIYCLFKHSCGQAHAPSLQSLLFAAKSFPHGRIGHLLCRPLSWCSCFQTVLICLSLGLIMQNRVVPASSVGRMWRCIQGTRVRRGCQRLSEGGQVQSRARRMLQQVSCQCMLFEHMKLAADCI